MAGPAAGHRARRRCGDRRARRATSAGGRRLGGARPGAPGMTRVGVPSFSLVRTAADVATAAQLACLLEASAPKPGNVSPGRHFADFRYEDLLASAAAIGGPLAGAATRPVGATVRLAVEATAR